MPHIRIKRLGTRYRENDSTKGQESLERLHHEELGGIMRAECPEDFRVLADTNDAEDRDRQEIDHHHGAEKRPDLCRARSLNKEEQNQDENGNWNYPV